MKNVILVLCLVLSGCASDDRGRERFKIDLPASGDSGEQSSQGESGTNETPTTERTGSNTLYFDGNQTFTQSASRRVPNFTESDDGFTLNFSNTDIRIVSQAVLADMMGLRFSLHPSVQGTLTLQSSGSIPKDALLYVFEEALQTKNLAMIRDSDLVNIVPLAEAPRSATKIRRNLPASVNLPGFGVQIISLQYTTASEMEKVLRPFVSQGAVLSVDDGRNLLIVAGTSQELSTIMQTVETFDIDWMKGMSFAMYPLDYVEPQQLVDELLQIFAGADSPISGMVRLIAVPRLNAILGISAQPEYLREVETWVRRLDIGGGSPGRRIYVYQARNGRASDLADALNSILSNTANGRTGTQQANSGARANNNAQGSDGATPNAFEVGGLRIVPNEETNGLLILASPSEYEVIERALAQMDLPPRQVLIEATLAEVSLDNQLNFGVQWFFETGDNSFTLSDAGSGGVASQFPGFSYVYSGSSDARAVLNAISSLTDVNVISSPKVMVINNQTANLQVGDQVPVATQSSISTTNGNAPLVNTVEFRDTGVILEVTPRIGEDGAIMLDITQEVSDVVPTTTSGIDSPTIRQRKITSSVVVQDGETIALGGLIRETISDGSSGIPWLRDIPLIGNAFGSTNVSNRRTELIILITPRIARDARETRQILEYLSGQFQNVFTQEQN